MALKNLDMLIAVLRSGNEVGDFIGAEPVNADMEWLTYDKFVGMLAKDMGSQQLDLLHMAVGISGESGELLDAIKKFWAYNKPLDLTNVIEELGDLEFYMQGMRLLCGLTREQVLEANYAKLSERYKGLVYSDEAAQTRADKIEPQLQVIDCTKKEFQTQEAAKPVSLSKEQVAAVDETAGLENPDLFENMPAWLQELVVKFVPMPIPKVLTFNTGVSGVRASVLFAGEVNPKFFYKPKESS